MAILAKILFYLLLKFIIFVYSSKNKINWKSSWLVIHINEK